MRKRSLLASLFVLALVFGFLGWQAQAPGSGAGETKQLGAPVLSARRVPELLTEVQADARARASINQLLASQGGRTAGTCVLVERNERDVVLQRPDQALIPASTIKLLTGAAALIGLGAETRFTTEVKAANDANSGVIDGPLYLVGGGDPLLYTNDYTAMLQDRVNVHSSLEQLADRVVQDGVRTVNGGVVVDDRRFDNQRTVPTWDPGYVIQGQVGPIGALTVNQGFGRFIGGRVSAPDPAGHAGQLFVDLLKARGVDVNGQLKAAPAPNKTESVAKVESPTVAEIVRQMLTESDNSTAEILTKHLGVKVKGKGTTGDGTAAVREVLADEGLRMDGVVMIDGSGLDRGNRATCRSLASVLDWAGTEGTLTAGLARAGETGTLTVRMRGTNAVSRIRAKTGSLNAVSGLAGWAQPNPGDYVDFAVINNGNDSETNRLLEDRLAVLLATLPQPAAPIAYAPDNTSQ